MESLEIRLLDGFALAIDGVPLVPPKSHKARSLIALLALRLGQVIDRDEVAGILWPEKDSTTARFNLRQCLSILRKECPKLSPFLIASDRTGLSLDPAVTKVDVVRFRKLASAAPRDAAVLFTGQLLPSFSDEWLLPIRADLNERALNALRLAAEGAPAIEAIGFLRQGLVLDPFCEPLQRQLIRKLAESGDLVGAENSMRKFRLLLHQELRAEPSEQMQREFRALTQRGPSQDLASSSPHPPLTHRLPAPVNKILGRRQEIKKIRDLLKEERLITLLGPGGSGKTRLAVAVGTEELASWSDGVWFVDFSAVQDGALVPQTLAHSLQIAKRSNEPWNDLLAERLRGKSLLAIFDNCEHLTEACAALAEMLILNVPGISILFTSRVPLEIEGERRLLIHPLELPEGEWDMTRHRQYSGLELFEDRARSVVPSFCVRPSNVGQVLSICRELDAIPLAIEMAAARLGTFSLDAIEARMKENLTFLRSPVRNSEVRRRDLNEVMEWSFELLSPEARSLFRRLSIFAAGCDLEAAISICGFNPIGRDSFLEVLGELVNASLVRFEESRYLMFATIKQFADGLLKGSGDEIEVLTNFVNYYETVLGQTEADFRTAGPDRTAERFRSEIANLRGVLQACQELGLTELGLKLLLSATHLFSALQLDGEAAACLRSLLESSLLDKTTPLAIRGLVKATAIYQSQYSDLDRAVARQQTITACEELMAIASSVNDREALAHAYLNMGRVQLWWRADLAKAALDEAQILCQEFPETSIRPQLLRLLGQHAYDAKELPQARTLMVEAQELAQHTGDIPELIYCLEAEAHFLRETGESDQALRKLEEIDWILVHRADARACAFNQLRFAELFLDRWDFEAMRGPLEAAKTFFGTSSKRLHGLLIDGLVRYLASFDGEYVCACSGLTHVATELVRNAKLHPSAYWHGACIELEALALCLAGLDLGEDALRIFGAAQSLRRRDWAFLSPGVLGRWSQFAEATGLDLSKPEFRQGQDLDPEEMLALAHRLELKILSGGIPSLDCSVPI